MTGQGEPLVYRSPGVGVRAVAKFRRWLGVGLGLYLAAAIVGTLTGGLLVLAGFVATFAYMGLPLVAHYQRVTDPGTQSSSGWLLDGTLTVSAEEVSVSSAFQQGMHVPRAEITDGWVEPFGKGGQRVVLRHQSGDLGVVEVDSLATGNSILTAVGLSADRHALRVRTSGNANQTLREMALVGSLFVLTIPLFGLGLAEELGTIATWAVITLIGGLLVARLAVATVKPVVRVGVDGIEITRGKRRRFLPIADIEAVERVAAGILIHLRVGAPRPSPITLRCWGVQQAALFARIQEVRSGFGVAQASAAQLARLERQGRDLPGWREAMRRVGGDDGGYRRIGLARDDLARVLGQGDAPVERRIGAALALASSDDPAERQKVRIAAQACASEELRAALERIAEDEIDEATLEAAMRQPATRVVD